MTMLQSLARRTRIRAATYLTAAFVLLAGTIMQQNAQLIQYQRLTANNYTHAFSELTASVQRMSTSLEKQTCTTSPTQIAALGAEIYGQAQAAQQAIGELPYAYVELTQTASFVSKVGDYAQALARSAATQGGYTGDQLETVKALSKASRQLSQTLDKLEQQVYNGETALEDLTAVEQRLNGTQSAQRLGAQTGESRFQTVETDFPELPTLIYDGPFSDSLQSKAKPGLEGLQEVTRASARETAAQFVGVSAQALEPMEPIAGDLPAWVFRLQGEKGSCTIRVTKAGGKVIAMLASRPVTEPAISQKEAVQRAKAFLEKHGFTDLTEHYYSEADGTLTVNFAAMQDDVLLYPDLIKVEVAMDNGDVVGFEAENYLTHHVERDSAALKATITEAQARKTVSPALTIQSTRLALIPTPGEEEVLCWEYTCQTDEGRRCMVYVNGQTGTEEKILLLIEDESGTLVQ